MMDGLIEGRIVHVVTSEREGAKHSAALVTSVEDAVLGVVNLAAFTRQGQTYAMTEVKYRRSRSLARGTGSRGHDAGS